MESYTQDPIFQVRNSFLAKLNKVLPDQRLSPRWNVLPSLAAKDPEAENVHLVSQRFASSHGQADGYQAKTIYPKIIKTCQHMSTGTRSRPNAGQTDSPEDRLDRVEIAIARLMLLLSHHPDFVWDPEGLKDIGSSVLWTRLPKTHKSNVQFHLPLP